MFTAYTHLYQEGIEAVDENTPLTKDSASSHYFFDPFRTALYCHLNKKELLTGMGFLSFAPNGRIWCQSGIYCYSLNELASYYACLETVLEEAKKSHARNVEIMIPKKVVVKIMNAENPFKDKESMKFHNTIKQLFTKFDSVKISYRKNYPKDVLARLRNEAIAASQPPKITPQGVWHNSTNLIYFNVGMTEDEMKQWAEGYARLMYDFFQSYMEEYEQDYGKEALRELIQGVNENKIKDLPPLKRNKKEGRRTVDFKVKESPFKRKTLCQNCESEMTIERGYIEKPENVKQYLFRCNKCLATRTINETGRTEYYGRYEKKKE